MTLKIEVTLTAETGESDTTVQEYTDSPFLATAINRAKDLAIDSADWRFPGTCIWQEVTIKIRINRGQ